MLTLSKKLSIMETLDEYIPQLSEIEELRLKINNIKPTVDEALQYINNELLPQFVYHCNTLSGTRISKQNTNRILQDGPTDEEKDQKAVNEILGLRDAYAIIQGLAGTQITSDELANLHKTLHAKIDETTAGILREDPKKNYKKELRDFVFWFNNNDLDAISFAAEAYGRYIFMHPFKGSNGRMARLVMNLAFLKRQFSTVIIPAKWKKEYEINIDNYDNRHFAEFIRKCIYFSQNLVINKKGNIYSDKKKRHIRGLNIEDDLIDYIQQNPGCKSITIKKNFTKISFTKLQRLLRSIALQGKIEFRGPTKTGGYYIK